MDKWIHILTQEQTDTYNWIHIVNTLRNRQTHTTGYILLLLRNRQTHTTGYILLILRNRQTHTLTAPHTFDGGYGG